LNCARQGIRFAPTTYGAQFDLLLLEVNRARAVLLFEIELLQFVTVFDSPRSHLDTIRTGQKPTLTAFR